MSKPSSRSASSPSSSPPAPSPLPPSLSSKPESVSPAALPLEQTEHVASARLFEAFKSRPDVKAVQTVSTPESCEIYVQIQSSDALHEVASILQSTLPPTALLADIYSRGGNIPVITPASAPTAKIEIDWQKAIVFGVDQSQIDSAVATLGTRPSPPPNSY